MKKMLTQSWEQRCRNGQMDGQILPFWPIFGLARIFPKKFGSVNIEYLWSLNFIQNVKKTNEPIILRKMLW